MSCDISISRNIYRSTEWLVDTFILCVQYNLHRWMRRHKYKSGVFCSSIVGNNLSAILWYLVCIPYIGCPSHSSQEDEVAWKDPSETIWPEQYVFYTLWERLLHDYSFGSGIDVHVTTVKMVRYGERRTTWVYTDMRASKGAVYSNGDSWQYEMVLTGCTEPQENRKGSNLWKTSW